MIKRSFAIICLLAVIISSIILFCLRQSNNMTYRIITFIILSIATFAYIFATACPHCGASFRLNPFAKQCYCQRCGKRIEFE